MRGITRLMLPAMLLGAAGCASQPGDVHCLCRNDKAESSQVRSGESPHHLQDSGPVEFSYTFQGGGPIALSNIAVLAGYPGRLNCEMEGLIECKKISASPLRTHLTGVLSIAISDPADDTFYYEFESNINEQRDGYPPDAISLMQRLIEQASSASRSGALPTTRPDSIIKSSKISVSLKGEAGVLP